MHFQPLNNRYGFEDWSGPKPICDICYKTDNIVRIENVFLCEYHYNQKLRKEKLEKLKDERI